MSETRNEKSGWLPEPIRGGPGRRIENGEQGGEWVRDLSEWNHSQSNQIRPNQTKSNHFLIAGSPSRCQDNSMQASAGSALLTSFNQL